MYVEIRSVDNHVAILKQDCRQSYKVASIERFTVPGLVNATNSDIYRLGHMCRSRS